MSNQKKATQERTKNTPFSCSPSLVERIDEAASALELPRSAWIRTAVVEKLENDRRRAEAQARAVELEF